MGAPEMWPAQREAVEFCLERPAAMLDMGMGCGKTRVAIEAIRRREDVCRVLALLERASREARRRGGE